MHAIQTSGNCIRNTTSDELAGVAADEIVDPRPYAEIIREWSTFHPEFAYLPRKFKIAISGAKEDRAATAVHDIGLHVIKNEQGEIGFRVMVGGGMGRTPILGSEICAFLPWQHVMTYLEAILRVYNQYGRRDNIYKARIKILVKAIGIEEYRRQVEQEWLDIKDGSGTVTEEELNRVAAFFTSPAYETLSAENADFEAKKAEDKAFANWLTRNVKAHKVAGYAAVVLSVKKTGVPPGDATAEQLDFMADLSDRYSFSELRVTHEQNVVLADVKLSDLYTVWQEAKAHGLATPNIGLLTDMICCPGGDFCSLANAKSIPIAEAIAERFDNLDFQHDIGEIELNISGCINACGHHHVGNIGILGVDKDGAEWYQVSIGGAQGNQSSIGKIIGPSFSAHQMPTVIERLLQVYVRDRIEDERFIDTARRVGVAPFKEHVYATPIKVAHPKGEDAYA
jgi:sulfite reductase (NADPH) hemoprotein beta-component